MISYFARVALFSLDENASEGLNNVALLPIQDHDQAFVCCTITKYVFQQQES